MERPGAHGSDDLPLDHRFLIIGTGPPATWWPDLERLVGGGWWIRAVQRFTIEHDIEALEALATGAAPVLELVRTQHHPGMGLPDVGRGLPASEGAHDLERACRAVAALGAVIVDPARTDLRDQALEWFRLAPPLADPGVTPSVFARSTAAPFTGSLSTPVGAAPPFAVALAALLAGRPLRTRHEVGVTVLFDAGHDGEVGRLHIATVPSIGPILLPDPASMALFRGDGPFGESLQRAWALRPTDHGVQWSLTGPNGAIEAVAGGSLGAAFAMALDEVRSLDSRTRLLTRLKRLGAPEVAVSADIASTGDLLGVGGIDQKLSAAAMSTVRRVVVATRQDLPTQYAGAPGSTVEVARAANLDQVLLAVRRIDRRAVARTSVAVFAAVIVCLTAFGVMAVRREAGTQQELDASQRREKAKALLAKANDLRPTDLRTSLLLTLESYQLDPSPDTKNVISEALGAGTSLQRVLSGDADEVAIEPIRPVVDGDPWVVAVLDQQGTVRYRSADTGDLLGTVRAGDEPVTVLRANPVAPWLVTFGSETFSQVPVAAVESVGTVPTLSPSTCNGAGNPLVAISPDGTRAAAAQGQTVCTWDLLTGERTAVFSASDLPAPSEDPDENLDGRVSSLSFGVDADTLLLGGIGHVTAIDLTRWKRSELRFDSGFPATSLAAYRSSTDSSEQLLVTTQNQLFVKFEEQPGLESVPLPEPEIRRIDASVDGSYVLATFDKRVVQLDPDADFQPSEAPDAIDYRTSDTSDPDLAVLDEYEPRVVALLGAQSPVVLSGRNPVQQRVTIESAPGGLTPNEDGSALVTFGEGAGASGYRIDPDDPQVTFGSSDGEPLDIPSELGGESVRLRDFVVPSEAGGDFVGYGYTYVGQAEDAVGFARVFDGTTFRPERDLILPKGARRQLVSALDAGGELMLTDISGHFTTFDTSTWKKTRSGRFPLDSPYAVALSPSGRVLALSDVAVDDDGNKVSPPSGTVSFYSFPSLDPIGTRLPSPGGPTWNLEFLDESSLVVHTTDEHLYRFDSHRTSSGSTRWQARPYALGDGGTATWFDVSPDHKRIAMAQGSEISVFRPADPQVPEAVLSAGGSDVSLLAFVDGHRSLVVATDGQTGVWDLPTADLEAQVCEVVGQGLAKEEWRRLVDYLPYERRCREAQKPDVTDLDELKDRAVTDYEWFEPSDADAVRAASRTCKDFAALEPTACTMYGTEAKPFALVSTAGEDDATVLTHWRVEGRSWTSIGEVLDRYDTASVDLIDVGARTQAVLAFSPENYDITLVLDQGKIAFVAGESDISGTTIVEFDPVERGMQSRAAVNASLRLKHRWDGVRWVLTAAAPSSVGYPAVEPDLLHPTDIGGARLGTDYRVAVARTDELVRGTASQESPPATHQWQDGLSATAHQAWTERDPMNLSETCWSRQLCLFGDDDGKLVGWRYDSGRARTQFGTSAPSADGLRLETDDGLEITDNWPDDARAAWPEGSLGSSGGLTSLTVGVVHPHGTASLLAGSRADIRFDPAFAGATNVRSVTVGTKPASLSFDQDLRATWETVGDQLVFTDWSGTGSMSIETAGDGSQEHPDRALLPGPGEATLTLTLCEHGGGVALTASGSGRERSWSVTDEGLVAIEPGRVC